VAAVALVGGAVLAGSGFRTLADERGKLQADLRSQYGVSVTSADANELLNGGKPEKFLPEQAEAAKLQHPEKKQTLKLKPTKDDPDAYDLFIGGQPWPS
jgi:hypothetical protein